MNSFSLNKDQIIQALNELDNSVLDIEFLEKLINFLPKNDDENKKIKNFKGDPSKLLDCEQLIYKINAIPRIK